MLISHISDIHLGYAQFNLHEREEDLYEVFEECIDKSINEHVDVVILAGDIFHNPKPNGAAIIKLARELKKLKDRSISTYFILGEHDISRTYDVPLPFLFHNLGLAKRLKPDSPNQINDLLIYGFNKERRSNLDNGLLQPFRKLEKILKEDENRYSIENRKLKKIVVLHQGLYDFNKFAGEIFSSDLPLGFNYYAMGHYHDHIEKKFPELEGGLVAYPGSIDLGHNEPISPLEKGFLLVDLSKCPENVDTQWIKLEKRRPQISYSINYEKLDDGLNYLLNYSQNCKKKPILELKLKGMDIDPKILSSKISKLNTSYLHYVWNIVDKESITGYSFDNTNDFDIDNKMTQLILKALKSENLTNLSLDLIQMINSDGIIYPAAIDKSKNKDKISEHVWKYYQDNKKIYQDKIIKGKEKEKEKDVLR